MLLQLLRNKRETSNNFIFCSYILITGKIIKPLCIFLKGFYFMNSGEWLYLIWGNNSFPYLCATYLSIVMCAIMIVSLILYNTVYRVYSVLCFLITLMLFSNLFISMPCPVIYQPYGLGIIVLTCFYKWENQDQGKPNNLSKVTHVRGNIIYW